VTRTALKRAPIAGIAVRVLDGIAIAPRAVGDNALAPLHDGFGLVSTPRGSTSRGIVSQTAALNHRKQALQQELALRGVNATLWQFVSAKAHYYNMRKTGSD
jgi:hypothetical protein